MPHARQQQDDDQPSDDGDLSDLLSELRILLPGAQMLTAFLIILPFNGGFAKIVQTEKVVFLLTFFLSMTSLVLLSAPAIQHRVMRPLQDRERFKRVADRIMMCGAFSLALAFILGTNLVMSEVFGHLPGIVASILMGTLIVCMWWLLPLHLKRSKKI
ncbi:hypothetical protein JAB5_08260 [Janthinobacterium sp. HH103]|uniref:Sodium:proton antiporter n=1 Tax=Janthinobacterium agaricidamnosum TaxID=55508 RepID=A0A3G2E8L9_9BURK|nr:MULTISPECIES: DUF6328 family protein [Janthinobacterium]AYM76343.1 hypothetical protein D9M09_11485 [Janthinobacterium agaricidamnosum]OEZ54161.1 hypothetical protein JAB2_55120 [Janthinobacterium sp. HH100]OEZ85781.1 hypothetical protein JAB5_08260 [Janthinobacterium sp. HH103]OEZ93293.1 hypothetical protein JAB8_04060 [Janthinobacterium sp. HH106]QOU73528.1 hypothetical protein JAB4_029840 [Janthinobacterium sp. HH102]